VQGKRKNILRLKFGVRIYKVQVLRDREDNRLYVNKVQRMRREIYHEENLLQIGGAHGIKKVIGAHDNTYITKYIMICAHENTS
jgi:hypothetical protein